MPYPENSKIKWQPYSQETFDKARLDLRPILLYISASWSRECRAYERETLESDDISKNLNRHLIPIWVDSDRRSDLFAKYGAFNPPTTVFMDFNGNEIARFDGVQNRSFLMSVMEKAASGKLSQTPKFAPIDERKPSKFTEKNVLEFLSDYDSHLAYQFDELYGGFGMAEKFPSTYALDYLAVQYMLHGKNLWKKALEKSLAGLENLQDPIEGGFFRYSDRRDFGLPHYEKMLNVNAAIADIYLKAGKVFQNDHYISIAKKNLEWMEKTLLDATEGGFFGSQASDEHFYLSSAEDRKKQKAPAVDRTKYCDWNAQAVVCFLHAHRILSDLKYWEIADGALEFMEKSLISENGAMHFAQEEKKGSLDGCLLDNAWTAVAFLEAYRIGKQESHLKIGKSILKYMVGELYSEEKGAFMESKSSSTSMLLKSDLESNRILHHGNAIACWALITDFICTQNPNSLEILKKVASNFLYVHDDLNTTALFAQIAGNLMEKAPTGK
ncbi:MAG: DUF255 domain-containing protein [Candidatus Micrarchaeota archaeon]